jgi:hypothetical protein
VEAAVFEGLLRGEEELQAPESGGVRMGGSSGLQHLLQISRNPEDC